MITYDNLKCTFSIAWLAACDIVALMVSVLFRIMAMHNVVIISKTVLKLIYCRRGTVSFNERNLRLDIHYQVARTKHLT